MYFIHLSFYIPFLCRIAFFKCFKEKTVTIINDDNEDFEERTILSVHKSLIDLQSLSVLVTKDPLHISSWSQVVSCKLTKINNSKLNKVKLVFDVLLLNFSHPTTTEVHDKFGLLGSRVRDGEAKWGSSFKVLRECFFIEGYWEWVEEVLNQHGPFLKGCKLYETIFASLFSYDCHAYVIRAFCELWCPTTNS